MAFSKLGSSWTISSAPIHAELGPVFRKILFSSSVITSRKPICDCASRTLKSVFTPSTYSLRSSSVSMYRTHLKWQHWRPRGLVIYSQTVTLGMCRSSFNVRSEENGALSSHFRIAASTLSSGSFPSRELPPIELGWFWIYGPSGARKRECKHYHRSTMQVHCEFQRPSSFRNGENLIIAHFSSSIRNEKCQMCRILNVHFRC
jgi:hypothetical protein